MSAEAFANLWNEVHGANTLEPPAVAFLPSQGKFGRWSAASRPDRIATLRMQYNQVCLFVRSFVHLFVVSRGAPVCRRWHLFTPASPLCVCVCESGWVLCLVCVCLVCVCVCVLWVCDLRAFSLVCVCAVCALLAWFVCVGASCVLGTNTGQTKTRNRRCAS